MTKESKELTGAREGKRELMGGRQRHFVVIVEEKAMASHSSTLAWRIPRMEEPGRLQSMGLLRVGPD